MRNNESCGCRCGHSCSTAAADSGDRRRGHAKARINLRKPIAQGTDFHLWHAGMRKDSKTLVLAAFFGYFLSPGKESTTAKRIATPVRALVRNDRGRRTAVVGSQEWVQGTASACGSINKIVPGVLPRTMPKHRDTTLLRRLLTQVGLMKCRYTSALLRAPPSEPKAQVPSTRRLRSHVPPSVPRPLSPGRALFGGLKWGTLSFTATLKSYRKISLRFSDKRV